MLTIQTLIIQTANIITTFFNIDGGTLPVVSNDRTFDGGEYPFTNDRTIDGGTL